MCVYAVIIFEQPFGEVYLFLFSTISGNHAAALSLAAKIRGIPAFIVVPKSAPSCKVENIKRYDGNVNLAEDNMQSREEVMNKVRQETIAIYIPSSNDGRIMRYNIVF